MRREKSKNKNFLIAYFVMALTLILGINTKLISQNLVINGSFEEDNYWDNYADTFTRFYSGDHLINMRNSTHWTNSGVSQNLNYIPYIIRTRENGNFYYPYLLDHRFYNNLYRDSAAHWLRPANWPWHSTPHIDITKNRLPHYPDSAFHGSRYIHLRRQFYGLKSILNCDYENSGKMTNDTAICTIPHRSNQARSGFFLNNYMNDIISNQLRDTLLKGKRYKLGFFATTTNNYVDSLTLAQLQQNPVTLAFEYLQNNSYTIDNYLFNRTGEHKTYAADGMGVLLTKYEIDSYTPSVGTTNHSHTDFPPQFRIEKPFMNKGEWQEFSWEFTADDNYTHLAIGNFWHIDDVNFIRWPFILKGPCCRNNGLLDYLEFDMGLYIDSVYLIQLGPILPNDTTTCWGNILQIKDKYSREVLWYREDGSSFISEFFEVVANKDSTRVVAFVDGEYDTMYVFGKKTAPYTLNQTDSLCSFQGRPFNRFEINSTEAGLQATWLQNGTLSEGLSFSTSVLGIIEITIIDSIGCEQTQNIESNVFCICPILPTDTILCLQEEIIIRDLIGCELTWILEDGSEQQGDSFRLVVSNPLHTVVARSKEGIYDTMFVQGKQVPDFSINHTDSLCHYTLKEFNQLQLLIEEQGVSIFWQLNGNQFSGLDFKSADTGILFLTIQDSVGCAYKDTFYLGEYCPEFSDVCAFPNAFSPNGDGLNDVLVLDCINISSVQITILNRWGEVIAMSSDYNHVWDGSFKGNPCPNGVYTLIIQYEAYNQPGKKFYYSGTLTLLR